MVVRTHSKGRGTTGLYIGTRNARRYFKRQTNGVELQLGHIHIHCALSPEFWEGQPEIFDTRLSSWLESKVLHERSRRVPIPMLMIPAEKNSFKLHPVKLPSPAAEGMQKISAVTSQARKVEMKTSHGPATHRAPTFITSENNLAR
jgi:hypothetical protein